jgi:hypothetical protein
VFPPYGALAGELILRNIGCKRMRRFGAGDFVIPGRERSERNRNPEQCAELDPGSSEDRAPE